MSNNSVQPRHWKRGRTPAQVVLSSGARAHWAAFAAGLMLLGAAAPPGVADAAEARASSIEMRAPQSEVVLIVTFPQGSGPDRFMGAFSKGMSQSSGEEPKRARVSAADLAQLANRPGEFFVLSNQELFPPVGRAGAIAVDVQQRLEPIAPVLVNPFFVVVSAKGPYSSMEQLLEQARQQPGAVSYGSWGGHSPGRQYGAVLAKAAQAHMVHIAYPSLTALYDALAAGEVDWALGTGIGPAAAAHRAGKIRYLAIADSEEDAQIKVPTLKEIGLGDGLHFRAWLGVFASAGTDADSIAAMQERISAAGADAQLREQYPSVPEPAQMNPAYLRLLMDQEPSTWGRTDRQ